MIHCPLFDKDFIDRKECVHYLKIKDEDTCDYVFGTGVCVAEEAEDGAEV